MNNAIPINIIRFLGFVDLTGFGAKAHFLRLGWCFSSTSLSIRFLSFCYPLRTPMPAALLSAFAMGILVDLAYDSLGVHAAASVLTAYLYLYHAMDATRKATTSITALRGKNGDEMVLGYASIMMSFHLFAYFSLDAFFPILLKVFY